MADGAGTDDSHDSPTLPPDVTDDLPDDADVVTVAELSQQVEHLIDTTDGVHHDYVLGDISGPSESSSGHLYFTLEGEDCELQCVAFSFRLPQLSTDPQDDMRALIQGDLQYYAPQGQLSLQVTDCHEIGEGSYSKIYRETKATLDEEGLFDDERKQDLPRLPTKIGIVTSKHGDAVDDAIQSIHNRYPGIDIEIAHASVQGDDAVETIVTRVARLDEDPSVDLIVVTRGGGADSTLRTFNELAVCRVIARTDTPIAVGIGHENDETLAGRVADERIITPTDAGGLVPERAVLEDRCERLSDRLTTAFESLATTELTRLADAQETAYDRLIDTQLTGYASDLDQAATTAMETTLRGQRTALDDAYTSLVERRLTTTRSRLTAATQQQIQTRLYELDTQLDQAYETFEREREHESELESAKTEAKEEARQAVATRERVYQVALVVLVLLLLAVLVVTFVL